jgi:enoyl-[acyl-carrier-protein] reductase (NADH)
MDLGLKGKSVLVTAASKGLGKASALEFAREGATVTIASRNLTELKRAAEEIEAATGQKITVVQMDVTREEDIARAVQTAAEAGGGLDVLVPMPAGLREERLTTLMMRAGFGLLNSICSARSASFVPACLICGRKGEEELSPSLLPRSNNRFKD